jgi:hypothetical protein
MDLAPLLCVIRATERPLLLLIRGLLLVVFAISTTSVIPTISPVSCVDFSVVLLLLQGSLAMRLKKSSPGFGSLNTCVCNCKHIDHCLGLLHGNVLHSLDRVPSVAGITSVPGVVEIFHVVPKDLIILLLDGSQSLSSRWVLVRALEVLNEHGT